MSKAADNAVRVEVRSREELRTWLAQNHATSGSVWLVTYKKASPHYLDFGVLIEELLCWGWVDSQSKGVDELRTSVRISPRNPSSAWSAANKVKVENARKSGAMTAAGEAAIAQARENGMWYFLDDVERLERPADLDLALGDALDGWDAWPRSIKRSTLEWIKTAKTPGTRENRIAETVSAAQDGRRPIPFA